MVGKGEWPVIGIDLGTTCSCVSVWRDGRVEIIPNELGCRTTPSCVAFAGSQRLIGDAAVNQARTNPLNTIFDMKRLIGRRLSDDSTKEDIKLWPFQVDGTDDIPMIVVNYMGQQTKLAPEEISAMVLAKMKGVAEDYLGTTVRNAIVTVPAHFNDSQRRATINAGTIAGLNVIRIINEPTAAAIAYGLDMKINSRDATPRKNVLVFDLGGGTLDVSLVVMDKGKIIVKATKGDSHLGGADFTTRMVSEFVKEFEKMHGKDISDNRKALGRLRDASEKAKKVLSAIPQTDVVIDSLFEGIDFSSRITRARFEELNADLFSICMETVVQCLKDAGIDKGNVDDVVLVGGSSRIPMVQQKLEEFFKGTMFCKRINRDEVVAYGAAVYAAILCGVGTSKKDIVVQELTPLALGIVVHTLEDAGNKNSGAHGILGSIKQGCQDFFKGKEHSKSFKPDKVVGTYNKDTDVMMTGVTSLSLGNVIQCLENAGIDKRDLHDVHLDGVRSENPKIHKILQQFSNSKELCKGINPDEVVSHGNAAIFSGVDTSNNDSIRGDIMPILIIPRNTTIPTKKNYTYWTTVDFQTHVTIQVYQGKSSYIMDNILIDEFEISGFQRAPKGDTKIDISFEIDVNGILNVSVESARLRKQITRIGHRRGLSNNQIQTMIVKAENYKAQDEIHRKIALAKNKVENYANELWDELNSDNVLESSAKKQLKDRIDKTLEWLVDSDTCEASEYEREYADLKGFNFKLHQTTSTLDVAGTQLRHEQNHPVTQGIKSVAAASYRPNPVPKASASQPYPPVRSQGTVDSVNNRGPRGNSGSRVSSKNQQQCPAYGQGYVPPTSESDDLAEECDSLTRNPPDNKSYKETGSTSHFTSGSGTQSHIEHHHHVTSVSGAFAAADRRELAPIAFASQSTPPVHSQVPVNTTLHHQNYGFSSGHGPLIHDNHYPHANQCVPLVTGQQPSLQWPLQSNTSDQVYAAQPARTSDDHNIEHMDTDATSDGSSNSGANNNLTIMSPPSLPSIRPSQPRPDNHVTSHPGHSRRP